MLALALSFVVLTTSLSVFSIPVPTAPITTVSSATTPTKTLSQTTGPATSTARLDVTSPLKFGELNAPSEGGVFNDFVAVPIAQAAPPSQHVPRADVESLHLEVLKSKRSILAHLQFEKQGGFPVFAEKKKGKGGKPPKAAAGGAKSAGGVDPAKGAGGKGKGKGAGKPAKAGGAGASDAADEED